MKKLIKRIINYLNTDPSKFVCSHCGSSNLEIKNVSAINGHTRMSSYVVTNNYYTCKDCGKQTIITIK